MGEGKVPPLFDERKTAELLHVKTCTVRNERIRGKLGFTRIGKRIFYTQEQISEYLQRQSVQACASAIHNRIRNPDRSEAIGSARSPIATGEALGIVVTSGFVPIAVPNLPVTHTGCLGRIRCAYERAKLALLNGR